MASLPPPPDDSPAPAPFGGRRRARSTDLTQIKFPVLPEMPDLPPPPPEPEDDGDTVTAAETRELRRMLIEQAKRRIDALNLYEPLPAQDEFHRSRCRRRLLRGSNRGGKTLPAAVECARAVTGRDPYGKYPKANGRFYIVGKDLKHIGEVIYPKLFKAGAFKIIRDVVTGLWRAYRPWQDEHRKAECKPAPPLIPPRMVAKGGIAWEQKAKNIIAKATLTNGYELTFLSSLGKPPQGMDLDGVWFDEEIVDGEWYPEMSARLLDRNGTFYWSATPQAGTDRLYELHLRCERELEDFKLGGAEPTAREYLILLADNPHIDADQKRALAADLDDASHAVRIGGEFSLLSSKVYPEFTKKYHIVPYRDIPDSWTKYAAVDPGRQICAALFLACPPPGDPDENRVFLYDELYIPDCDAEKFGAAFAPKAGNQQCEAFFIDHRMGRQTEIASGKTVEDRYAEALEKNKCASRRTGSAFEWGSDDVAGGLEACRTWLRVGEDKRPRLQVMEDKCGNFLWEIARYRYKRQNSLVTDQPEDRGRVHLMAALRYLAMADPKWVDPGGAKKKPSGAYAAFLAKRQKKQDGGGVVTLGPRRGV